MSYAIKASKVAAGRSPNAGAMISRRAYMGDPGLFGFLGNVAKTVGGLLPGPIGTAARLIGGATNGGGGGGTSGTVFTKLGFPTQTMSPQLVPQQKPTYGGGIKINPPFFGPPGAGVETYFGPQGGGVQTNGTGPAPSGYHWNKSDYFLKDGTFVPKGSKLVKNRRRNPMNPRAMSRAISRLEMGKRAAKRLNRIAIKCKRCGYSSCRCKG